jgi:hypothetical protein
MVTPFAGTEVFSELWQSEAVALPLVTAEGADAQVGRSHGNF